MDRCPHSEKRKLSLTTQAPSATLLKVFAKNVGSGWTSELIRPLAYLGSPTSRKQMVYEEEMLSSGRWYIFPGRIESLHISLWLSNKYGLWVIFLLQSKKNSFILSEENHASSRVLHCSHCFLDASSHQASRIRQTVKLKNGEGMVEILMHEQSNEECQSHTCCKFSNYKKGKIRVTN